MATNKGETVCSTEFGRSLMRREFCFDETSTPVNHGSYGTVPKRVLQFQLSLIEKRERDPEHWYRYITEDSYIDASSKVAEFIGCRKENLVLVENATTGINAVLKSMSWSKGDTILCTDHTYGSISNLANFLQKEDEDVEVLKIDIPMPIEDEDQVVDAYAKMFEKHPEIKIAIIDNITSVSAIIIPVGKLVDLCHKKGVLALIDGAHGPGQLNLDLDKLAADYYVGNLHKWLFCPRGCALLWIHPSHHDTTHPVVVSAHIFHPNLQRRFSYQGTRDNIPYLTAPKAIEFYQSLGGMDAVVSHNRKLLEWAASMLSEAWNSTCLPIPTSMRAPCMLLVGLPNTKVSQQYLKETKGQYADAIMKKVFYNHRVHSVMSHVMGKLWCRVSANVYNSEEDYYKLRDAVLDVLKDEA